MVDLLTGVEDGALKAGDVKNLVLQAVQRMYEPADCWRREEDEDKLAWCRWDGTCRTYESHREAFADSLAVAAERWCR